MSLYAEPETLNPKNTIVRRSGSSGVSCVAPDWTVFAVPACAMRVSNPKNGGLL